jgi:hypothetical protein
LIREIDAVLLLQTDSLSSVGNNTKEFSVSGIGPGGYSLPNVAVKEDLKRSNSFTDDDDFVEVIESPEKKQRVSVTT